MRRLLFALALLFGISPAVAQNYTATPGAGLTFGSKLVTSVNYPQWVLCDPTTPAQCAAVTSGGVLTFQSGGTGVTVTQGPPNTAANAWPVSLPSPAGTTATTLSAWNSSTTVNSTQTIMASGSGALAATVELFQTNTLTAGAVTYEGTYDGTFTDGPAGGAYPISAGLQVLNTGTVAPLTNPYTLVASTNQPFLIRMQGYQAVRIRLSIAITGTGTVTPKVTLLPYDPAVGAALLSPIVWPTSPPPVRIDQTTKTVTNGVMNAGSTYNTVAASQTAQALTGGLGGATGDYLSHCVLQPTTTAAGTMTILDNATVIFTFTTGTLSNLSPIPIPIGALSVSGAWKVTTGANETATCFGKFT